MTCVGRKSYKAKRFVQRPGSCYIGHPIAVPNGVGMRLSVRLNFSLVAGVTLVSLAIALYQTQSETRGLKRDLEHQAALLAETLEKSAAPLIVNQSGRQLKWLVDRFQNDQRLARVAVYNGESQPLAVSADLAARLGGMPTPIALAKLQDGGSRPVFLSV